jgi:hypothetical protein
MPVVVYLTPVAPPDALLFDDNLPPLTKTIRRAAALTAGASACGCCGTTGRRSN